MEPKKTPEERIVILRSLLGKTQAEFAEEIGMTQGALSQIENKNRGISTETLIKITEKYKVNADWLLHGNDTAFKTQKVAASTPLNIPHHEEHLIPLVDKEAHADYPTNFHDNEYVKKFKVYRIPGFEDGDFRMFEVEGESMEPTLFEKEIIITEFVDNYKSVGDGKMYVVVTTDGLVVKRVYVYEDGYDAFILKSDNPKYKSFKITPNEVHEIWEVKGKITNQFLTAKAEKTSRISELEERMEKMENLIKKLIKR